jgi:hypothetical protein
MEGLGKVLGRNYFKKARVDTVTEMISKNSKVGRAGQLTVGLMTYNSEEILKEIFPLFPVKLLKQIKTVYKNNDIHLVSPNALLSQELKNKQSEILEELQNKAGKSKINNLYIKTESGNKEDYD